MTEDEMYDIIRGYEDSERDYHERNIELENENVKLRELIQDYDECLDTALYLAGEAGYPCMPDEHLFKSLRPRMRELVVGE